MAQGKQDEPSGGVTYRLTRAGDIRVVKESDAEHEPEVEIQETYITARLSGNSLELRVASTGLIDGERLVNRTVDITEKDDIARVRDVLRDILHNTGDIVKRAVRNDALTDYRATLAPRDGEAR